jgi:hypothetical protein
LKALEVDFLVEAESVLFLENCCVLVKVLIVALLDAFVEVPQDQSDVKVEPIVKVDTFDFEFFAWISREESSSQGHSFITVYVSTDFLFLVVEDFREHTLKLGDTCTTTDQLDRIEIISFQIIFKQEPFQGRSKFLEHFLSPFLKLSPGNLRMEINAIHNSFNKQIRFLVST